MGKNVWGLLHAATLLLMLSTTSFAALLSPVSVTEPVAYMEAYKKAKGNPDLMAFKSVVEIIYDAINERPWGEKYFPEAEQRWTTLRLRLCPSVKAFCDETPENFDSFESLLEISEALRSAPVFTSLQQHFSKQGYFLHTHLFPESGQDVFSVLLTAQEEKAEIQKPSMNGLNAPNVIHIFGEQVQVASLKDYGGSATDYVTLSRDHANTVLFNQDSIKIRAIFAADLWAQELQIPESSEEQKYPVLFFERNVHRSLNNKFKEDLQSLQRVFLKKLKELPLDLAGETLRRFEDSKPLPVEAYQHLNYRYFRKALESQGTYLSLVQQNGVQKSAVLQGFESLLTIQQQMDPQWLLFLLMQEMRDPESTILSQLTPSSAAAGFLREELDAMLDLGRYRGNNTFSKIRYAFEGSDLFYENLSEDNASLFAQIANPDGSVPTTYSQWNDVTFKRLVQEYVAPANGRTVHAPFMRTLMTVILRLKDDDSRFIARTIQESRSQKTAAQSL